MKVNVLSKRLLATIRCDIQLQFRNGFYYAAAFVASIWVILLRQIPGLDLQLLLPSLIFNNLIINTFYFISGLVLLEKGEGTLEAQVVTPLRTGEYLASKVITLTLLSLVENLLIAFLVYGLRFQIIPLAAGVSFTAASFTLLGFIAVARYDSLNEYLLPSMVYILPLVLPVLSLFGLLDSWLFYLHPLQGAMLMVRAAFQHTNNWLWLYALVYSSLWIAVFFWLSQQVFARFIIRREGAR